MRKIISIILMIVLCLSPILMLISSQNVKGETLNDTFYSGDDDRLIYNTQWGFDGPHDATSGTVYDCGNDAIGIQYSSDGSSGWGIVYRDVIIFDLTSIPAETVFTSVILSVYITEINIVDAGHTGMSVCAAVDGYPSIPPVSDDFDMTRIGSALDSITSFSSPGYHDFTLSGNDLVAGEINSFYLRTKGDIDDTPPINYHTNSISLYLGTASLEAHRPKIYVEYEDLSLIHFTSSPILSMEYGTSYSYHATINKTSDESFTLTTNSTFLSINTGTGYITGTPYEYGTYSVNITATWTGSSPSSYAYQNYSLIVNRPNTLAIQTSDFCTLHYLYDGWQVNTSLDDTPFPQGGNMTGDVGPYPDNDYAYTAGYGMYVKWDLSNIPDNVTITSASVSIYIISQSGLYPGGYAYDGLTFYVLPITSSWSTGITFNGTLPNVTGNASMTSNIFDVVHEQPNWTTEIDVTDSMLSWYNNDTSNYGVHLKTWAGLNQQLNVEYYYLTLGNTTNYLPRLTVNWEFEDTGIQITSSAINNTYTLDLYEYQVTTNRTSYVTYELDTNASWLSIGTFSGLVSGTSSVIGNYSVNITAIWNGGKNVSYAYQNYTLTVYQTDSGIHFISTPQLDSFFNEPYLYHSMTNRTSGVHFSLTTNASFLIIDNQEGWVNGTTPANITWYYVNIKANWSDGYHWYQAYQNYTLSNWLSNDSGIQFTSTPILIGDILNNYSYHAITNRSDIFCIYSIVSDAAFLSIDGNTGWVNGTPDMFNVSYQVSIKVKWSGGNNISYAWQNYTLTVWQTLDSGIIITSIPLSIGFVNETYSYQVITNRTTDIDYTLIPDIYIIIPPNADFLSINETGYLSGIPNATGTFNFYIVVNWYGGIGISTAYQNWTITIFIPDHDIHFVSSPITIGYVGIYYEYDCTTNRGSNLTFSLDDGGASWLQINTMNGAIGGEPDIETSYLISIQVEWNSSFAWQNFTLRIIDLSFYFTSSPILNATVGMNYSYHVTTNKNNNLTDSVSYNYLGFAGWLSKYDDFNTASAYLNGSWHWFWWGRINLTATWYYLIDNNTNTWGDITINQSYMLLNDYGNNSAPTPLPVDDGLHFTSTPNTTINLNEIYYYHATTNRPLNVIYSFSNWCPIATTSWLTFNNNTGILTGLAISVGTYEVNLTALWFNGNTYDTAYQNYLLSVIQDTGIHFISSPITTVLTNNLYSYHSDTNRSSDVMYVFSFFCPVNTTSWLSIDINTGIISGTAPSISGWYYVNITAIWPTYDLGNSSFCFQNYTLFVTAPFVLPHSSYGDMMLILFILGILTFALAYGKRKGDSE